MEDIIDTLLPLAKHVAAAGAAVHRRGLGRTLSPRTKSSEIDVVSEIDLESERVMINRIRQDRPDDSSVSEEGENHRGQSGVVR
jgi:myo-inositol-1(or 4)-monophosphatase